jgi:hypothetical protein
MVRDTVERILRDRHQQGDYLFPAYEDYCFGNVPDTVRSVLDAGGRRSLPDDVFGDVDTAVDTVVLILVDGFGLDAWRSHRHRCEVLHRLDQGGTVTPLTSIYPSETAAAITTLETGQLPCEHGRIGWNVYDPRTDRTFRALDGEIKTGNPAGTVAEESAVTGRDHYEALADAGIDCHRLQPFDSGSDAVTQHTYDDLDSLGERLSVVLAGSDAPRYVYAYVPHVDHAAHAEGTDSERYARTVTAVCEQISALVDSVDDRVADRTLLLVTADHGHVDTDPDRNIDLSANATVMANLRRHANGTPVRFAGSPRNVHLHLREGTVPETRAAVAEYDTRMFTRQDALDRDLFGDYPVTDQFRRRCGDLVVTHRELGLWFGDVESDELSLVGMHGGLHPAELLVPFAAARVSALA